MANPEAAIHRSIVAWLRAVMPHAIIHHSPNEVRRGGKAGHVNRAMNAALGVVPGFPDILVLTYTGPLFFEIKAEGGRMSDAQKVFRDHLAALGYKRWAVVRSIEDVREYLDRWDVTTREGR